MLHLLNRVTELDALIKELQECAKLMDNESSVFINTTKLVQQYMIEKIRIEDTLKVWNKKLMQNKS